MTLLGMTPKLHFQGTFIWELFSSLQKQKNSSQIALDHRKTLPFLLLLKAKIIPTWSLALTACALSTLPGSFLMPVSRNFSLFIDALWVSTGISNNNKQVIKQRTKGNKALRTRGQQPDLTVALVMGIFSLASSAAKSLAIHYSQIQKTSEPPVLSHVQTILGQTFFLLTSPADLLLHGSIPELGSIQNPQVLQYLGWLRK